MAILEACLIFPLLCLCLEQSLEFYKTNHLYTVSNKKGALTCIKRPTTHQVWHHWPRSAAILTDISTPLTLPFFRPLPLAIPLAVTIAVSVSFPLLVPLSLPFLLLLAVASLPLALPLFVPLSPFPLDLQPLLFLLSFFLLQLLQEPNRKKKGEKITCY